MRVKNHACLQYLDSEIIVEEELLVDNVGEVAAQLRQLQIVSQLKTESAIIYAEDLVRVD